MRRISRRLSLALLLAALLPAFASSANAAEIVLDKVTGAVKSSCIREDKNGNLICLVVYTKPPYLGFQFGSQEDPDSVAVTAGARRATNSKLEIKVGRYASHAVFGEGFVGKEAEAIRDEIESGTKASISFESQDTKIATQGEIDLKDFKAALREVEALRDMQGGK